MVREVSSSGIVLGLGRAPNRTLSPRYVLLHQNTTAVPQLSSSDLEITARERLSRCGRDARRSSAEPVAYFTDSRHARVVSTACARELLGVEHDGV